MKDLLYGLSCLLILGFLIFYWWCVQYLLKVPGVLSALNTIQRIPLNVVLIFNHSASKGALFSLLSRPTLKKCIFFISKAISIFCRQSTRYFGDRNFQCAWTLKRKKKPRVLLNLLATVPLNRRMNSLLCIRDPVSNEFLKLRWSLLRVTYNKAALTWHIAIRWHTCTIIISSIIKIYFQDALRSAHLLLT